MTAHSLKAGFACRTLEPFVFKPLGGYAAKRISQGIHDPLYASAIVLQSEAQTIAVCSLDLLACDDLLIEKTKSILEKQGFRADHLILACTHTHSAYAGILDTSKGLLKAARHFAMDPDEELISSIADTAAKAILAAAENIAEADLAFCRFKVPGIASNRADLQRLPDDLCTLIRIHTPKQQALLSFFACHPTVLGPDNLQITADFPGACRQLLAEHGFDHFFFFNGAAGDLSCRYTRKSSTFEEADRLGRLLGQAILSHLEKLEPMPDWPFAFEEFSCTMDFKEQIPEAKAQEQFDFWCEKEREAAAQGLEPLALREIRSSKEGAMASLLYAKCTLPGASIDLTCSLLRIGRLCFLFVPAEIFSSLQKEFLPESCILISCANGYHLYLADKKAHADRTYEALSSFFKAGEAEKLMQTCRSKIEQIML